MGGRNLILGTTSEQNSLSWTDWYSSTNIKSVRGLTAGTYTLSFQLHSYEVQDREEGKLGVHMYVRLISKDNREINLFVDPFMSHSVLEGKYVCTFTIDDTDFDVLWFRFRDMSPKGRKTISYSSIKLERGTVATDWTPAPEDVAESVTSLESKLLDPTTGEIHKLTSQLTTSAQQTLAEAVKRAGEMDKQIKVGGRNLIVASRWKAGYLYGDRDENAYPVGSENYKVLVGYNTFRFDPVYIPTLGESKVTYKLYDNGGDTNGTVQIHAYDKDKKFLWWSFDGWNGTIGHTNAWTLPADTAYIRLGVTNENVRAKVEFGTIATDWTPAPEDVAESVSTVNTSLVSLASTLLDPNEGDIPQLFSQLESHKKATDKSFEDLATHPLTIDKDGYWQVWSVKDSKYLTTQYKSRGDKGDKGEDAGRYLGRAKRIHRDFDGNYLLEPEGSSWQTAKEGDYVYLVGDLSNRGGDKDTYYIVREHKSKTVWEVYNIKGRSPVITLDSQFRLLADGQLLSQQSLKGVDGRDGRNGTDGKDGHTPVINWDGTKLIIDDKAPVDLRGQRGEPGHSPSPGAVLNNPQFRQLLGDEVTTKVTPFSDRIDEVKTTADQARTDLDTANTKLDDLDKRSLTTEQKRDLGYLTYSLQTLKSGSNGTLEGLTLQRYIALSGDNQTVSAYLASNALPAVLKAGITGFGTPQEREQVEITHAGTGHIGNLYFQGNQIDFRTGRDTDPYLSIGAEESTFIDGFVSQARLNDTPVIVSSVTLTTTAAGIERPVNIDNDGTRLTIHIDKLFVAVFGVSKLRLTLDGETLAEWRGSEEIHLIEGGNYTTSLTPYEATNLTYERVVKAGSHTVRLSIINPTANYTATINGLRIKRRYDTGAQQSALTRSGLRLFGSPDRYFDVDYRQQVPAYFNGMRLKYTTPNDYTVRIKGGAKIDKLTADELDVPGVPLCGASFNENGGQEKAFGKYVNRQGQARAQAVYYPSGNFYRVFHSIGNTNYIPTLQIVDDNGTDINWSLTARIYAVQANDFAVRVLTKNNVPIKHAFAFVAFKTM